MRLLTVPRTSPHLIVVGAGMLGASIAWHLARGGARVTVLERDEGVARGVTHGSYGWVGSSSMLPSEDPARFRRVVDALPAFDQLQVQLGALPMAARGALLWAADEDETLRWHDELRAADQSVELLGQAQVGAVQPGLHAPSAAIWSPRDFAVEPAWLVRQLLKDAAEHGAQVRCSQQVLSLMQRGSRITGVRTTCGDVIADGVVLAAAMDAAVLCAPLGITLPLRQAPAVLMDFDAPAATLQRLLCAADLEVRPGLQGGLRVAADAPANGEAGLPALVHTTQAAIRALFVQEVPVVARSAAMFNRPTTRDGEPVCGFLPGVDGLYVAVAHPGIILAPQLGQQAAKVLLQR
ncbi:TPA: FAD-binding oxidoreductase [Stenotrophomonas maltophilia]|nr:FAD-binding oxidoreductase [Stenotrophomonas maltophilia]